MDILNRIKSGHPVWILFKSGIIKALNIKTDVKEKTAKNISSKDKDSEKYNDTIQRLENSVRELNERFDNFRGSFKDVLKIAANSGVQDIKNNEIKIENMKEDESKKDEILQDEAIDLKETAKPKKKIDSESNIKIGKTDWEQALNIIKSKSISLNSLLAEVKKYNTDSDKIMFFLPDNYNWHKEKLNDAENMKLIRDTLNSILGKNFYIEFLLESQGEDLIDLRNENINKDTVLEVKDKPDDFSDLKNKTETKNKKDKKTDDEVKDSVGPEKGNAGLYDYLEEKFKIKEKKNGS
jgi:predicted HicB family RNase H-like nuclease